MPAELRKDAKLESGDTLEVQLYNGTIVMRKREPLTPQQCAVLLEQSHSRIVGLPDRMIEKGVDNFLACINLSAFVDITNLMLSG